MTTSKHCQKRHLILEEPKNKSTNLGVKHQSRYISNLVDTSMEFPHDLPYSCSRVTTRFRIRRMDRTTYNFCDLNQNCLGPFLLIPKGLSGCHEKG